MSAFKESQEAQFRKLVRGAIRAAHMTKSERDVVMAITNHWLHHRNGPKGFIHPSRNMLAKKAGVSVRTVATTLASLRESGVLVVVSDLRGGKSRATQYRMNAAALLVYCGCEWGQEFITQSVQSCTVSGGEIARFGRAKIAHCNSNVAMFPSQERKAQVRNA